MVYSPRLRDGRNAGTRLRRIPALLGSCARADDVRGAEEDECRGSVHQHPGRFGSLIGVALCALTAIPPFEVLPFGQCFGW